MGSFFQNSSLWEVGHVVQLGHHHGDPCTNPEQSTQAFMILHVNGIHIINLVFCSCSHASEHSSQVQQLLRRRLLLATTIDPSTACTFQLLCAAHVLSVQSKLSLYNYYLAIENLTDATRMSGSKVCLSIEYMLIWILTWINQDRYWEFLRMIHMWQHLKLLKRGGQAHCCSGVDRTEKGELAVLCPTCPYPTINLPKNWRSTPKDSR